MASTSVVFDILAHDRASGKFDTLGKAVSKTSTKMSVFTGFMQGVGQAAAHGLGVGIREGTRALVGMVGAAIEDASAADKLAGALQRNAGATDAQVASTEKWIAAQGRALGVTDDELRPALGALVTATHDVGKAQELAGLAMDVSAARGKSLQSVSEALMKAQNGNVAALARLGINTKNAAGETITMEQATKRMADQFGGAAQEKAGTLQGKMDRLKLIMSETGESIGAKLLPVVTQLANWILTRVVPAVAGFIAGMQSGKGAGGQFAEVLGRVRATLVTVGAALIKVTQFANKHRTAMVALAATIAAVVAITRIHAVVMGVQAAGGMLAYLRATRLVTTATKVYTAVQWALNVAMRANPIGLVITGLTLLAAGVVLAYKKSETFRTIVNKLWGALKTVASFVTGTVVGAFNSMKTAVSGVVGLVQSLISWIGKIDLGILGKAAELAGKIFRTAYQTSKLPKFEPFAAGSSIFGTDLSVEEGAPAKTVADILKAGEDAKLEAQRLAVDVSTLIGKGLSDALLTQLQEAGTSGAEQIHLLAGGTAAEIAAANAQEAARLAALKASGVLIGTELAGLNVTGPKMPTLADLKAKGGDTYNITVNGSLNGPQTARLIVTAIKTYKRVDYGGRELGIA